MLSDSTDLSKAVMSDGAWHIIPEEHVNQFVSAGRESVIVHQCPMWNAELRSPDELPYEPLGYWTTASSVKMPCKLCHVHPPEAIANLFLLHNFDTFAGDPSEMSREISKNLKKTFSLMEHAFFLHEDPCQCEACHKAIGAWE